VALSLLFLALLTMPWHSICMQRRYKFGLNFHPLLYPDFQGQGQIRDLFVSRHALTNQGN